MNLNEFQNDWSDKDVEKHWDQVANIYVAENNRVRDVHDQRFVRALDLLDLHHAQKVLNVSSRDCGVLPFINERNIDVDVINAEISQGLIDQASKMHDDANQLKITTYSSLPLASSIFERVLSFETLEHVENPVKFLMELNRVTVPGGRMVLSCPPATSEASYQIYTCLFGGHGEGPHKFPSSSQVKEWFKRARWELIHHEATLLIPVGPRIVRQFGEWLLSRLQKTFISELGIRQFYVCKK